MSAPLHQALAQARMDDVRGAADAHRVTHGRLERERSVAVGSVTLRFGSSADQPALERLAEIDSARPPAHPVLLGEVDGHLRAALALVGGAVVAAYAFGRSPHNPNQENSSEHHPATHRRRSRSRTSACFRSRPQRGRAAPPGRHIAALAGFVENVGNLYAAGGCPSRGAGQKRQAP